MIRKNIRHSLSLLNVDYVKLDSRWNYRNVISPYHRIYYIDEGEGELSDSKKNLKLEPGYLYIIPHYTLCDLICPEYLSQYFVQFFEESSEDDPLFPANPSILKVKADELDVAHFQRLIAINPGRGINRSDNPQVYEKNIYYKEYQQLNNNQNLSVFLETQGLLLLLISRFAFPEVYYKKEEKNIPPKILNTMHFIMVNLHQTLSVKLLAERAHQNTEYFSRLFEKHTGTRPLNYIVEKRVERAQHMITTSQASYSEIADLTGFKSLSNFSRTFKRITELSPRQYYRQFCLNSRETHDNLSATNAG